MLQYEPDNNAPHFTVKGTMPSLNEYLNACGRHPQAGGKMKRDYMFIASNAIRRHLKGWATVNPVIIHFRYFEPDKRRDKDNIHAMACKCITDALQQCGTIKGDGWAHVENSTHDYFVDRGNPRIEVYLEEV